MIQSERVEQHRDAIRTLLEQGLAYRCYASEQELDTMREAQKAANQAPRYDNRHRHLTPEQEAAFQREGREAVIRFRIDDSAEIRWTDLVRGPMSWRGTDLGGDMVIAAELQPIRSATLFTTLWWWSMTPPWPSHT